MVLPLGDLHPTRITPIVTYALIAINVVVYLLQVESGDRITLAFACTPWEVTHDEDLDAPVGRPPSIVRIQDPRDPTGRRVVEVERQPRPIPHAPTPIPFWMTLFTAMFLHGSPMHLIGNMLYLWIVGDNVEEVLGSVRYIIVYLACGLMGALAQIIANPDSMIPTLGTPARSPESWGLMSSGFRITRSGSWSSGSSRCFRRWWSSAAGSSFKSGWEPARSEKLVNLAELLIWPTSVAR